MKCPYQTRVVHKPEYTAGCVIHFAEDITVFYECSKNECPFYYTSSWGEEIEEHCGRAEKEGAKK